MATNNPDIMNRLARAREPKAKKLPVPIARKTPLPKSSKGPAKRSEKMKGVVSALRPLYDRFLAAHPDCEIQTEACTGPATCVHHTKGRGIKVILDSTYWKASCTECNTHVEIKDGLARQNGHKVSRHTKG